MGKGKTKDLNPADVQRKKDRQKELKKNKEVRKVVRTVQELLSDPTKIDDEIRKVCTILVNIEANKYHLASIT